MISVDDVSQFCVVWVSACSMGAGIYAHIVLPRFEAAAALVQTAVNLKRQVSKKPGLRCVDSKQIFIHTTQHVSASFSNRCLSTTGMKRHSVVTAKKSNNFAPQPFLNFI